MARFQFRLESLARLRAAERDERRAELAEAYRAEQLLVRQIAEVSRELGQLRQRVRQGSAPGDVHVDRLLQGHRYQLVLGVQMRELEQKKQKVLAIVEQRRAALLEADRQVRLLDKLREKRRADYDQQQFLAEIKSLDEAAQQPNRRDARWAD